MSDGVFITEKEKKDILQLLHQFRAAIAVSDGIKGFETNEEYTRWEDIHFVDEIDDVLNMLENLKEGE